MADWRSRSGVQAWMLSNLVHGLISLDRWDEVPAVVDGALRLPADQTRPAFIAWRALLAARSGRWDKARDFLSTFDDGSANAFALLFAAHARLLVETGCAAPGDKRTRFAEARAELSRLAEVHRAAASVGYMIRERRVTLLQGARLAGSPWRWVDAVATRLPWWLSEDSAVLATFLILFVVCVAAASEISTGAVVVGGLLLRYIVAKSRK